MPRAILAFILGISVTACGAAYGPAGIPLESEECPKEISQIQVGDAFLRVLCGCGQAPGTSSTPEDGGNFKCTVPQGSTVVFLFDTITTQKQVLSEGSPGFVSSAVVDPDRANTARAHAVAFAAKGTYSFRDAFVPELRGTIQVK